MTQSSQRGFTLIEVIVALAIVVLSIGALLGAVTSAASNTDYLRDRTFAQWVALNKLTETRVSGSVPGRGVTAGETDYAGRRYAWRQTVERLPFDGMFKIDVSARRLAEGGVAAAADAKDEDVNWTATVTGVMGTAVRIPSTPIGPVSGSLQPANAPGSPAQPGTPGGLPNNPGQPGTPVPLPPPGGAPTE